MFRLSGGCGLGLLGLTVSVPLEGDFWGHVGTEHRV